MTSDARKRQAGESRLVIIDPDDREQVERIVRALPIDWALDQPDDPFVFDESVDQIAAALRSLLAPPKPDEPTGLGAVVATESDGDWIRVSLELTNPWLNVQTGRQHHYDRVPATHVLSDGVQP